MLRKGKEDEKACSSNCVNGTEYVPLVEDAGLPCEENRLCLQTYQT